MNVRTRFAPSPTGDLHLGGVRTALFNWLLARKAGGLFVLRLDDTDRERSTLSAERSILEGLSWLGLTWDGAVERQSERAHLYADAARQLEAAGHAYRCWCSVDELEARRKAAVAAGRSPGYDRRCRGGRLPVPGADPVLRLAMPLDGETVVDDACRGRVVFQHAQLDDLVITRADGSATYNFATVVDDALMGITHIVRGDDLLNSTPRQMQIYAALGHAPPAFAHLPMVLGPGRQRLSKRHGAEAVLVYRDRGFLPEALLNAAARLGWSGGGGADQREVFTMAEVMADFTLEGLTLAPATFDANKLAWLNHEHMRRLPAAEVARRVVPFLAGVPAERVEPLIEMHRRLAPTLVELASHLAPLVAEPPLPQALVAEAVTPHAAMLADLAARLREAPDFAPPALDALVRGFATARGLPLGPVAQALRVALVGAPVSAGIFEVAAALGRDAVLARIARAVQPS